MLTKKNSATLMGCTAALSFLFTTPAQASPSRSIAREHWQAIAGGDVNSAMADYRADAAIHWKNGGLKGDYSDATSIRSAWAHFAKTRTPLKLAIANIQEAASDQDRTIVTAEVTFSNDEWTYPLQCRLVLQNGKIAEETWKLSDYNTDPGAI